MANVASSTATNVLFMARCRASAHNDALGSRESAADIMGIDRGRLYRIETGIADPYPDEILLMADLYGDPKLMNWYCREKCPLGGEVPVVEDQTIEKLTLRALVSLRKTDSVKNMLLDLMADGVISEDEIPDLQEIIATLDELNEINQNLKNWTAQYKKQEG